MFNIKLLLFMMANLNIATLNINGMNERRKQELLEDYLRTEKITCCLIQEHNLKCQSAIYDIISDKYDIFFNASIKLKGGTMILLDKSIKYSVIGLEMSHDSRIISLKINIESQYLHLLNVYAPSGKQYQNEREDLFKNEILYYLRNSLSNTVWGGDFNCIIRKTDVSNKNSTLKSIALENTIKHLKLTDAWFVKHISLHIHIFERIMALGWIDFMWEICGNLYLMLPLKMYVSLIMHQLF